MRRPLLRPLCASAALLAIVALTCPGTASAGAVGAVVGGGRLAEPGVVVDLADGVPMPADNEAASYLLADLDTGAVLAAKSPHLRLPPASTLKVLTALTLLPVLDKDEVVLGTDDAVQVEGSKIGIEGGLTYTVDLLFKGMLLQSGNDAAHALAGVNGGLETTVEQMNAVARELQALDTTVVNPSGLDEPAQLTSSYDLALVARAALARQDFRDYLLTPNAVMPGRDGTSFQIQNENRLLATYDGAIGVKNGYTTLARHTFIGAAERDGRSFVVTVMRTEGRAETVAASLLDWAFANADGAAPVGQLVAPAPVPILQAATEQPATLAPGAQPEPVAAAAGASDRVAEDGSGTDGSSWTALLVALVLVLAVVVLLRARAVRRERARSARRAQPRSLPVRTSR